MKPNRTTETLYRFFAGLTEYAFEARLGVADTRLIDYVTDLLARFVRYDALVRLRTLTGQRLDDVTAMLLEAESRIGDARREAHRHIGDFTLFWAGVYPEALRKPRRSQHDYFGDYCAHGKRSYRIASTIRLGSTPSALNTRATASAILYGLGMNVPCCPARSALTLPEVTMIGR